MIKLRKKICKSCKTPQYIFSKGDCKSCTMKRYQKNQYEESKEENKKDKEFFERAYKFFKHTDGWMHCLECGIPIKNERWSIHHILPKSIYPDLRYEIANVVPLCRSHHSEAESSISYLKMKKYSTLEQMKRMLLDNYGINNKTT